MTDRLDDVSIGFVGLGLMGAPMAKHLADAGADLVVTTRNQDVLAAFDDLGIATADTPADAAEESDFIIICVADTPAVENVLLGDDGIIDGMSSGALVIDMGTTEIESTRSFAEAVRREDGDWLDAPVSGGQKGAEEAALSIMAGGTPEAFERALPIFDVLGNRSTHVGPVGAGQIAKAGNQLIVGITIEAVAEALTMAREAGIDPARVLEALQGGFADSRILQLHGRRMVERDFEPGGKATTQRKDLDQALLFAEGELGLELPGTRLALELYDDLIAKGGGDLDHSALVKVIEKG